MMFRPAPLLTLFSLISLAILIALGLWQVQRMQERAALFETIVARVSLPALDPAQISDDPALEFRAVTARVLAGQSIVLFGPAKRGFQAVQLADGRVLLGETGGPGGVPAAGSSIDGVLRRMAPDPALPADDPAKSLYYQPGPALARALGAPPVAVWYVAARAVPSAQLRPMPNPRADPRESLPGPERNLGYALTWFGLAAGLVCVYLALHARMGRLKLRP